jgi:D-glycero-alpha-D-manno-heptose-7-phosphate kinase
MKIVSKAPCRVDLAGGTLDIWPLYLFHQDSVTVNFAVDRYTYCELASRPDRGYRICSRDLDCSAEFTTLDALLATVNPKFKLVKEMIRFFAPHLREQSHGWNISTHSEAPAGAGISGSSALLIATASALNKVSKTGFSLEKIREIAQNVEARIIRVPTGCQDYYPAMYGGVSAIHLTPSGIHRVGLPVDLLELNQRFVLAYTGEPRDSGINNWEVTKAHIGGDAKVHRNFDRIAAIANGMRTALEAHDWTGVARLLREEWLHRKKNAPGITTPLIDKLVEATKRKGALAAKVCGAGGGGCVLFLVEPGSQSRVGRVIEQQGAAVLNTSVAPFGVEIKTTVAAPPKAIRSRGLERAGRRILTAGV